MRDERVVRGSILMHLKANRGLEMPYAFMLLLRAMRLQNHPLSPRDLSGECEYLSQKGYLTLTRREDLPGFRESQLRADQSADQIYVVQLTAKGVDLLDGAISDPGVVIF